MGIKVENTDQKLYCNNSEVVFLGITQLNYQCNCVKSVLVGEQRCHAQGSLVTSYRSGLCFGQSVNYLYVIQQSILSMFDGYVDFCFSV